MVVDTFCGIGQRKCAAVQGTVIVRLLVEECREQLHVVTIVNALLMIVYFISLLFLRDDWAWLSAVVLGVSQSVSGIGTVLTVRVLIYRWASCHRTLSSL